MATVEELQAKIKALRDARDSGVLMVRHGEESTQFRSLAELNSILSDLESQLKTAEGTPRSRVSYISQSGKGF